jgi:apolipoprotein N-acyltransferase
MPSTSPRKPAAKSVFIHNRLRRPLSAAASGLLLSLSFPSAGLWFLAFVALVPLLIILHRDSPGPNDTSPAPRGARWAPWIAGIVFNVVTFCWIVRLPAHAMTHPWLIFPGLLALGLYLGLYVALFGWIVRLVRRRLGWPVLAVAPIAWAASEWAKSSGVLGCPWGNVGYALAQQPAWIQTASLAGAPALSFWILVVNSIVAAAFVSRRWWARVAWAVVALLVVWLPVRWGEGRLREPRPRPLARVALVQPNIASDVKWNPAMQDSVLGTLARITRAAASLTPKPSVIIWPETALPYYVRLERFKLMGFLNLVREAGVPVLAGYPDARLSANGSVLTHNAAGLVLPNGKFAGQYEKIHLVPFGERVPFQGVLPFLGKIDLGQAEWTPGTHPIVFAVAGASFGVLICFESIFPDLARRYALEGAQHLVNITNDEWFGESAGPVQHADMAILRSVELGLSTARCANTGISMLIDPYGRVVQRTPLFREALLSGEVWAGAGPTLFLQWGDWLTSLCLGLTLILVAIAWFRPFQHLGTALTSVG